MRVLATSLTALSLLVAGCSANPTNLVSSGDRYVSGPETGEGYKLGVGDQVRVTVFNESSLTGEHTVSASGFVSMPLIGDVPALDKTPGELAADMQRRLSDGYLRDPKVAAEVTQYRPYFILGEVKLPGQYPYAIGLTALNAVATAQGYTPRAAKKVAYIRRAGEATETAYALTPNLRIYPGDTIRLGERYF